MEAIENCIKNGDISQAIKHCIDSGLFYIAKILSVRHSLPIQEIPKDRIRVLPMCNWCSTETLVSLWDKMSQGNGKWETLELITHGEPDYYIVINAPSITLTKDMKKKTIIFRMEPDMLSDKKQWREYADPVDSDFLRVFRHENGDYNNNEWHLSKTYTQLSTESIVKNPEYNSCLSTVLSAKYKDEGHVKRINFVKFLESKQFPVHVYGSNKWDYVDYKGELPPHQKDAGIFPYKYTFNVENQSIANYYTEKLIDGILGECLVFYSGCYNVKEYLDPRAFVYLELNNFEKDYETVKKAIEEDWHSQRLPYIREAKKKILNELQFFPRLYNFLQEFKKEK